MAVSDHPLLIGPTLVLGGARSGKSRFAEELVAKASGRLNYIATAQAFDDEMQIRIKAHQKRRGERWHDIEEPLELVQALEALPDDGSPVLVDCLTLWLSNLMHGEHDLPQTFQRLVTCAYALKRPTVFVSNEVGLGIVPDNALARRFRDEAGRLHQAIAETSVAVYFIAAGLPLKMK